MSNTNLKSDEIVFLNKTNNKLPPLCNYSFNVISGASGTGKSTIAYKILDNYIKQAKT